MAWIPQDVVKIPLRFWTRFNLAVPEDFSGALSFRQAPVLLRSKDDHPDSDPAIGKAAEEHRTHRHARGTRFPLL